MKTLLSPLMQFKLTWSVIGSILVVSAFLIGVVVLLHYWKLIPFGVLTRDAASTVGFPIYTGFLSQVGILCWAASAAVCLFCAKILSKNKEDSETKYFLFASGLLTVALGIDDTFLFHEELFPYFGVPQKIVEVGYIVFVLFYLIKFFSTILKTEYLLLAMALGFFGSSVALDLFADHYDLHVILGMDENLLEDSVKLIGIVSWLTYFFRTGTATLCHL